MYEIIQKVIDACDNNITRLDYEEAGLHFIIRNVGKGKVVYVEKHYNDAPSKMVFESYGLYKDGILYFTDSYWIMKQKDGSAIYASVDEISLALSGRLKSYGFACRQVEEQIKNVFREYLSGKDIPERLEHLSDPIKELGKEIAFDIALKGESEKIEYTINRFELRKDIFEDIFFGLHDISISKIAEDYMYENDRWHKMYEEYLAKIYADTLDYSDMDVVKMYKALASADMKTINATIEGNGHSKVYKLNVEMLRYDIAFRRDLRCTTFTCQADERECKQLMDSESDKHLIAKVFPNQITKITYGKKVIYEKEEA